jgi:TatD DNase family protein
MELWDTHVHLDELSNLSYAVNLALRHNVTHWVLVATGPVAYRRQSQLLATLPSYSLRYLRAIGLHPEYDHSPEALLETARIVEQEPIAAIGEIGLPTYRFLTRSQFNRNWHALYIQLGWAERKDLAVIIHAVHEATEPMLRILEEFPNLHRVVFHWLKAPPDIIHEIAKRGYYVGITPDISFYPRDRHLLSLLSPQRVILETDSPWPHIGHRISSPAIIAQLVATLNQIAPRSFDWMGQTTLNARRLFGVSSDL